MQALPLSIHFYHKKGDNAHASIFGSSSSICLCMHRMYLESGVKALKIKEGLHHALCKAGAKLLS